MFNKLSTAVLFVYFNKNVSIVPLCLSVSPCQPALTSVPSDGIAQFQLALTEGLKAELLSFYEFYRTKSFVR